jgi:hypothetical protein
MRIARPLIFAILGTSIAGAPGCGSSPPHCTYTYPITPATATLDHTVVGNAQNYVLNVDTQTGCTPPPLPPPNWKLSDTTDASITVTGTASCKSAAANPITVSATNFSSTATLVCK